ncbi:MAG: DUF222 domain-containing protein [Propionibacteriaceae bacterium]|nr:DUF222 domain-containing protein [Propionibacteriaceae bacterium]
MVLEALVGLHGEEPAALEPWRLTDRRLLAELAEAQLRATRAQARWLELLAEAERREVTLRQLGLPTAGWLTDRNTHWARSAREEVRLAVRLDAQPLVARAVAEGALSLEQARVIVHGLDRLPDDLDGRQREAVAAQLVEFGSEFGPYGLSRLVNRAVEVVAPEVAEEADRRALERVEAEQERDRYLTWRKDADGALLFRGKLGKVAGQQLVGVLRSLAARQRKAARTAGSGPAWTQAHADALVELASHFCSCGRLPRRGGDRPRLLVSVELDVLGGRLGAATLLNTGDRITAGEARRLACDADILPVVLDGRSVPLDLGRRRRLFAGPLRALLIARDQGCAFPGCDRGPQDCDGHHIVSWYTGGRTELRNGVLLCQFHHRLVEPDPNAPPGRQWLIRLDSSGRAEFGAPEGMGAPPGERRWRQHHRYRS